MGSIKESAFFSHNVTLFQPFKENRKFDLSLFRKDTVEIAFDAKYGLDKERFANPLVLRALV